jgi:ABC-type dipeptide/oligopeptide/nickel transport system permease component
MLRRALGRLLWLLPAALGASLVTFFVLSLAPLAPQGGGDEGASLPLFFNVEPRDVRARADAALAEVAASAPRSAQADRAAGTLVRLGGAALPFVIAGLDALGPDQRRRVALALAPLARRMQLEDADRAARPESAVAFWHRFWDTHGADFRPATARSIVRRFARYGTEGRAQQLRALDTYALPELVDALGAAAQAGDGPALARVVDLLAHVAERDDRVAPDATRAEGRSCTARWQRWWVAHRADYVVLAGAARVAAFVLETRYGRWALEALSLGLGEDERGRSRASELWARARVTLLVGALGLGLAYLAAVVLGAAGAFARRSGWALAAATLVPYVLGPVALGVLGAWLGLRGPLGAALLLALALSADPTRHQMVALAPALWREHVRATLARGAGPARVVAHALRGAMMPVLARAAVELPAALTGAFVLERALALRGLGEATLEAVARRDVTWLMCVTVGAAAWAVLATTACDVAAAALDPRLERGLLGGRRIA